MKTIFKLTILAGINFCFTSGFSQLNYFLPDSNAYFSISDIKFWFQGDTLIESKLYKKVFYQERDSLPDFSISEYYAAVREDTINERIYTIQRYDGKERLLTDFLLNPDDTITVYTFWPSVRTVADDYLATISTKDSVEIHGNYHKRLGIEGPDYDEFWIEGIGSTFGLFFSGADRNVYEGNIPILLCIHIEDTLFWDNPDFEGCYIQAYVSLPDYEPDNIDFSISLVDNKIYITCNEFLDEVRYNIVDMQGRTLLEGIFFQSVEIDISNHPKGNYLIQLSSVNKLHFMKRKKWISMIR